MLKPRCQLGGRRGADNCAFFDWVSLVCGSSGSCEHQEYPAFDEDAVEEAERVGTPEEIQRKITGIQSGEDRLKELYKVGVYDDVLRTMTLVAKYQPGTTEFHPGHLQDIQGMSEDILQMTALSTRLATVRAQVEADFKQLDAWRHRLHADKFMTIKESYNAGLRLGKPSEKIIEYQVRRDKEYTAAVEAVLAAERQSLILHGYYDAAIELVNALKKRIDTMRDELKHVGRT